MKKLLILALFAGLTQTIKSQTQNGMYAKIKTNKGEILIQLEFEKTPLTVANFVGLSEGKIENIVKENIGNEILEIKSYNMTYG